MEKKLAIYLAQLEDAKTREEGLRDENKTLTKECHEADKAKAIAQTQSEGYLTQIEALKKELKSK